MQPTDSIGPRLTLAILVTLSRNMVWTLEQPRDSLLIRHRRMDWICNKVSLVAGWGLHYCIKSLAETTIWGSCPPVTKVYQWRFWMMLHWSGSAKPTVCYSNMREIEALDLGPLRKEDREQNTTLRTTRNLKAIPCCNIYCPWECFSIAPQLLPCCLLRTIHRQKWSQALSRHSWAASFTVPWLLRWRIWVICWGIIDIQ